jgi:hypothetical protein
MEARMPIGYQTVIAAPIVFRDVRLRFLSYERGRGQPTAQLQPTLR